MAAPRSSMAAPRSAALALALALCTSPLPALTTLAPTLAPIGVAEIVWNKTAHACPQTKSDPVTGAPVLCEEPDSVPIAWHNPLRNLTYLISATDCTFPSVGPNLSAIVYQRHECGRSPYVARRDPRPWTYDNHQWLQSARVFPNGSGVALVHNEFHGEQPPHNESWCSFRAKTATGQCILWSSDTATTTDGGSSWQLAHAPAIALPRPYVKDAPIEGYGVLGQVQYQDGYYYSHVSRSYKAGTGEGPPGTAGGTCVFRARDLGDPSGFRGWNGTAWSTSWVDPYKVSTPSDQLWRRTCQSISLSSAQEEEEEEGTPVSASHLHVKKFAGELTDIAGWPTHVMSGLLPGAGGAAYFFPSEAGSVRGPAPFSAWEAGRFPTKGHTRKMIDLDGWLDPCHMSGFSMMYPNLLDHDSPFGLSQPQQQMVAGEAVGNSGGDGHTRSADGLSYGLVGNSSLFLYFVVQRHLIVRVPVAWFLPGQALPRGPFPPPTAPTLNSANCSTLRVVGADLAGVNGVYRVESAGKPTADGTRRYKKDADHYIYHIKRVWVLGRPGRGGERYFSAPLDFAGQGKGVPTTWGVCSDIRVGCEAEGLEGLEGRGGK
eukprot:COSAG06_NODE_3283_length_5558_cov_2.577761_6_plen_601_part_00